MKMQVFLSVGCVVACLMSDSLVASLCSTPDCANYPRDPLTFHELRQAVMGGQQVSRVYYEVFSMNPMALRIYGLPILRKTSIRWIVDEDDVSVLPGNFSNDYAGWIPFNPLYPDDTGKCKSGKVRFETLPVIGCRGSKRLSFRFMSVYPTEEVHIGTSFSSFPEKYLINWYCPETQLVYRRKFGIKWCKSGARMSIYGANATKELPWADILKDLRKNKSPKLSDPRWTMTFDAPQICEVSSDVGTKK